MSPVTAAQAISRQGAGAGERDSGYDLVLLYVVLALLGLGLVMVTSSSVALGSRQLGDPLFHFWRQLVYIGLGVTALYVALKIPVALWQRAGPLLLIIGILLLMVVLVPGLGREVNGSMRWIALGPVNMQPSELVKLFMAIYLAGYLVRRQNEVREDWAGFFKPMLVLVLIALLLLLEPDYGATVVLFATVLGMLFLGGVPTLRFSAWLAAITGMMAFVVMLAPYRVQRLTAFMDPWADPFDTGFQLTQALIAVGRGGWFGVGLGNSVQKLFYLPEAHTDFLYAVLGEELGLIGMLTVILLFVTVVWRAFFIARRAEQKGQSFAAYLAYGLGIAIGLQAFTNIGVNLGVLPTKGLTLPLMSYGGSSLLVNCLAMGLLLRIDRETRVPEAKR